MPLITCPDCGRDVSDLAPTCPQCGRPLAAGAGAVPVDPRGSGGNAIAALASFFVPGLGQLIQGRVAEAFGFVVGVVVVWVVAIMMALVTMGIGLLLIPAFHLWCVYDAATWSPQRDAAGFEQARSSNGGM